MGVDGCGWIWVGAGVGVGGCGGECWSGWVCLSVVWVGGCECGVGVGALAG